MDCSTPGLLSITNSRSLPKLMSTESVMPSNHLILFRSLLLLPSIFPSIRVFSDESVLRIRSPKYWSGVPLPSPQLLSHAQLFVTPWTAEGQASLSFTISQSLLKLMSFESVMPSKLLVICLLLPSIFPSIRVFSNESVLCIRWRKC